MNNSKLTKSEIYIYEWNIDNYHQQRRNSVFSNVFSSHFETYLHMNGKDLLQLKIEFLKECNGIVLSYYSYDYEYFKSIRCSRILKDEEQLIVFLKDQYNIKESWTQLAILSNFKKIGESNDLQLRFEFLLKEAEENKATESYKNLGLADHLMNSAFSDVTVKTSEGEEIPAHKVLLVSRSAVFRALFDHDTVEKSTNLVESPFPTHIVNDLLCYIYTDTANNIDKTASRLLVAADYYHLDGLKALCEDELVKSLNIENAVDRLTLADTYHADRLKKRVLEYMRAGKNAAEIIKTDGWKSMESATLAKSIYEFNS